MHTLACAHGNQIVIIGLGTWQSSSGEVREVVEGGPYKLENSGDE